MFLGP